MRAKPRRIRRTAVACALALSLAGLAGATTLLPVSMDEMLAGSQLVFEGRALSARTEEAPGRGIRTCVRFHVIAVVKGGPVASPLELCFAGGSAGGRRRVVYGLVQPRVGEHGIYFVAGLAGERMNPLYGWHQGHFLVGADGRVRTVDGRAVVGLDAAAPAAPGVARGARVAAPGARGAGLDAPGFEAELRARLAGGGG